MNRNTNERFSGIPTIDIQRSRFDRSFSLKTTFSSGKLIPIMFEEVLPGDTVTLDTSLVCRMTTPIYPVMDNCFMDIYYFFVPNRLVWNEWSKFMGEDDSTSWEEPENVEVPVFYPGRVNHNGDEAYKFFPNTLADYFGLPVNQVMTSEFPVSALPFRAYYLIWNEFFRAQAVQDPVFFEKDSGYEEIQNIQYYNPKDYVNTAYYNLALMPVGKFHDYFTSCLPSPQKGQPVVIPLNGQVPVLTSSESFDINNLELNALKGYLNDGSDAVLYTSSDDREYQYTPNNLYVDLATSDFVSVNDLRNAVTIQHFMEMESRGGSRYTEIIKTFFGVTSPDARLQRPEYLGGKQVPINIDQVVQTSSTNDEPSPIGHTSGFSLTGDTDNSFTYSSTEHGMIIGLCCVRPRHTYQRGIEKKWSRRQRFDFYFPVFANISEQPVFTKELDCSYGISPDDVFGYQEAWAEYRYNTNRVTGGFRENAEDSLSAWVYTDTQGDVIISDSFIKEDPSIIGDTLAYTANENVQFLADFYFNSIWTRPMPVYSVPGLSRL